MRQASSARRALGLVVAAVLALVAAGCRLEVRGGTRGYTFGPTPRNASFTSHAHSLPGKEGAQVVVLDEAGARCEAVADVTATAGPEAEPALEEDPARLEARLPWQSAIAGARNQAATAGANAIVVEGIGINEHHEELPRGVFAVVYARAYRCP